MMNEFTINGIKYTKSFLNGYCYKHINGKRFRIRRAEFEQAMAQAMAQASCEEARDE